MSSMISSKRSVKKLRSYKLKKREAPETHFQKLPLISKDSDSDDEIIIHDASHFQSALTSEDSSFNLRNIKHLTSHSNGNATECVKSSDPFKNCEFLYLNIEEGDSLQSISIKYQCPISDLKRANNLMTNQEFFALKHLKIPVKKHSLLTEILPASIESKPDSFIVEETPDSRTINIGIGTSGRCPSPQDSAAFFKKMDEDLVKIMLSTNSQKESLEAAAVALTTPQIHPLVKDSYSAYDCGIQWNYLILFIIVIAVVVPLVIALYMYMRSSDEHHHIIYTTAAESVTELKNPS